MADTSSSHDHTVQAEDASLSEQGSQIHLNTADNNAAASASRSVIRPGDEQSQGQPNPGSTSSPNPQQGDSPGSTGAQAQNLIVSAAILREVLSEAFGRFEGALERSHPPKESESNDDIKAELAVKWLEEFLPTVITVTTFGASIVFSVIVTDSTTSNTSDNVSNGNSTTASPKGGFVTKDKAKHFSALAWLFFVIALGLAGMAYVAVTVNRPMLIIGFKEKKVSDSADGYEAQKIELEKDHDKRLGRSGLQRRQGDPAIGFFEGTECSKFEVIRSYVWMQMLKFTLAMFVRFPFSETVQIFVLGAFVFLSLVVVAYNGPVGYAALAFTGVITLVVGIGWLIHVSPLVGSIVRFLLTKLGIVNAANSVWSKISSLWRVERSEAQSNW